MKESGSFEELVYTRLLEERSQGPSTRQPILRRLEEHRGRKVVTFFTSFRYPVLMNDEDADLLEGLLQKADLSSGLSLILNSPGGMALAAERVIRACRTYSGGDFEVIVPKMAKSAATMICLGASRIIMSDTSELGPIDPQVVLQEGDQFNVLSAWSIIQSYRELFEQAIGTQGNIEPFLQQLDRYDARLIKQWELELALGKDIVIRALQTGMLKDLDRDEIEQKIELLIDPEKTMSHGRPIYWETASDQMGLNVEHVDNLAPLWQDVYEVYVRSYHFTSQAACKLIETAEHHFSVSAPRGE